MERAKAAAPQDKKIHRAMARLGYKLERPATNREDKIDKWDYLYSRDGQFYKVDHKTCSGVQESHKILWEKGQLKVDLYARLYRGSFTVFDTERFWAGEGLKSSVNRGGQRYYYRY